jgi:hypothetical protein
MGQLRFGWRTSAEMAAILIASIGLLAAGSPANASVLPVPTVLSSTAVMAATNVPTGSAATTNPAASTPQCSKSAHEPGILGDQVIIPVSSSGSINCFLAQGDISSAVSAMQSALNNCNSIPVAADGEYGPRTKQAVAKFQSGIDAEGGDLAVDGIYGPATRQNMAFVAVGGGCDFLE